MRWRLRSAAPHVLLLLVGCRTRIDELDELEPPALDERSESDAAMPADLASPPIDLAVPDQAQRDLFDLTSGSDATTVGDLQVRDLTTDLASPPDLRGPPPDLRGVDLSPVPLAHLDFVVTPSMPLPAEPWRIVVGDFNGDGKPDLAITGFDQSLRVLLGKGDGTFSVSATFSAMGYIPAVGDFDGDGHLDVAVSSYANDVVWLLRGVGDGTFTAGGGATAAEGPSAIGVADFNLDGKLDLAVQLSGSLAMLVQLGNGDGTFTAGGTTMVGWGESLVVADFNTDGKPDVASVASGDNRVDVLLGHGDGTLAPFVRYAVGISPERVAAADVDGDGDVDLVVNNAGGTEYNTIGTLLNRGDGSFDKILPSVACYRAIDLAAGDLDGDGRVDLAVTCVEGSVAGVMLGAGDGRFFRDARAGYVAGLLQGSYGSLTYTPYSVAVADLDGDGRLDLVAGGTHPAIGVISVLNQGGGWFRGEPAYAGDGQSGAVVVGDWDGDGWPDFATVESKTGQLGCYTNQRDRTFRADIVPLPGGAMAGALGAAAGDLDGDGRSDVVVTLPGMDLVAVLLARSGTPTFAAVYPTHGAPAAVALGDLDGDGHLDVVLTGTSSGDVSVLGGTGTGALLLPGRSFASSPSPEALVVADVTDDGLLDVVTADQGSTVTVLRGDGTGMLAAGVVLPDGASAGARRALAAGDLDGDGRLDLVVVDGNGRVSLLLSSKAMAPALSFIGLQPEGVVLADFDGDGHLDVAASCVDKGFTVMLGGGDGTLRPPQSWPTAHNPTSIAAADLDLDGRIDALLSSRRGGETSVLFNASY